MLDEHRVRLAGRAQPLGHHLPKHPPRLLRPPGVEQDLDARRVADDGGPAPRLHLRPHPHGTVHVPGPRQPVHDSGEGGGVGRHPGSEHLGEESEHGRHAAGFAEEVDHGGVGEAVVAEGGRRSGGEAEEEEGLLERRMGLEHARHGVGVPGKAWKGEEERARRRPGVVPEDGGGAANYVAGVGRRRRGRRLGFPCGFRVAAARWSGREEPAATAEHGGCDEGTVSPRRRAPQCALRLASGDEQPKSSGGWWWLRSSGAADTLSRICGKPTMGLRRRRLRA